MREGVGRVVPRGVEWVGDGSKWGAGRLTLSNIDSCALALKPLEFHRLGADEAKISRREHTQAWRHCGMKSVQEADLVGSRAIRLNAVDTWGYAGDMAG